MLRKPSSEPFWEILTHLLNIKCTVLTFSWDRLVGIEVKLPTYGYITCPPKNKEIWEIFISSGREVLTPIKNSILRPNRLQTSRDLSSGITLRPILSGVTVHGGQNAVFQLVSTYTHFPFQSSITVQRRGRHHNNYIITSCAASNTLQYAGIYIFTEQYMWGNSLERSIKVEFLKNVLITGRHWHMHYAALPSIGMWLLLYTGTCILCFIYIIVIRSRRQLSKKLEKN
jgi:hypothetical protein